MPVVAVYANVAEVVPEQTEVLVLLRVMVGVVGSLNVAVPVAVLVQPLTVIWKPL